MGYCYDVGLLRRVGNSLGAETRQRPLGVTRLSAEIVERGIVLTGGGALLKNLDKRLSIETGLPVSLAEDPLASVVLGTGKMLSDFDLLKRVKWDNSLTTGT